MSLEQTEDADFSMRILSASNLKLSLRMLGVLLLCLSTNGWGQSPNKPVTLTFLDIEWDTPDLQPGLTQDLQDFTRETGIQVKRLGGPNESLSQLALWRELLQKGTGTPDVCGIDVIWPGILSPYLMDLKPYFATELSSEYPVVVASYTVGDKVVAIPRHAYIGVLLYRPNLLKRYGYREPPRTWDELDTMAAHIQAGERAKGKKDFWGFVWQGAEGEDLTCNGLEWQVVEGGGRIIEDNKTISVNNPQVIRTWQRAARWVGSISPASMIAYRKWDAANVFASGRAAFFRWWEGDYSLVHWVPLPGEIAEPVGITSVPGSKAGRVSCLGGNGLAVSRTSAHPREAIELVRFLVRRDGDRRGVLGHSEPPQGLDLYELPAILKPYARLIKSRQAGGGLVVRPSIVAGQKYEDVSRAYIRALHSVLMGQKNASVAAAELEKELVQITGFKTGPPPEHDWWSPQ
jgi:trehalose/maltose transport system substrate-binding protein